MALSLKELRERLMPGSIEDSAFGIVSKTAITESLRSIWLLPQELLTKTHIDHFLRSWEGTHLESQVVLGRICYQRQHWNVIWQVTPARAYAAKHLLLSFRGNDTYGRFVIIRIKGEH
mgnify:CR=1 FL=1